MSQEFTADQLELLNQPLDANRIKHRPGGGRMLRYISGDSAIDAANRIFGFGKWGYKVIARSHEVIEDEKKGRIEFYTADIELSVIGAAFPFPGDGIGVVNSPYTMEMHEKARKEAATDALKRALRHYGDQFGLCLYDEDDYVQANDGSMVQVKEVRPGQKQQSKRVVDATKPQKQIAAPPPASPDIKQRLNDLFDRGREKGLFHDGATMAKHISDLLKRDVKFTDIRALSPEDLSAVEKAINAAAAGLNGAA